MTKPASHHSVENVSVDESHAGQRIDNYLLTRLKGVPKSLVYRLLRSGQVRVNSGRKKPGYRLQSGDTVRIPPLHMTDREAPAIPDALCEQIEARIVFENDDLLIINKPSGLAVHAGSGLAFGVIEILRQARGDSATLELAHRLDRDTSGNLVLAKNRTTLLELHDQLRGHNGERRIEKTYQALVAGAWSGGEREVSAALSKNTLRSGERITRVDPEGKPAISLFNPLHVYSNATLVEVDLRTGRTHQIRAHAAHIGHAVAGDARYGENEVNREFKKLGLKRLFLHATRLRFRINEWIDVTSPLDDELQQVLARLKGQDEAV